MLRTVTFIGLFIGWMKYLELDQVRKMSSAEVIVGPLSLMNKTDDIVMVFDITI